MEQAAATTLGVHPNRTLIVDPNGSPRTLVTFDDPLRRRFSMTIFIDLSPEQESSILFCSTR